ncbi:hypothetical protein VNO78_16475 [Psophocarpus tetragonolobus]|uniref:Uncharacterized protein n=1 Tax=Psophocarpus tetragonolobus TaxID=3891 RepID=A0AAN9XKT4_PSOTE
MVVESSGNAEERTTAEKEVDGTQNIIVEFSRNAKKGIVQRMKIMMKLAALTMSYYVNVYFELGLVGMCL